MISVKKRVKSVVPIKRVPESLACRREWVERRAIKKGLFISSRVS